MDEEYELVTQLKRFMPPSAREQEHPGLWPLVEMTSACSVGSAEQDTDRRSAGLPTVDEVTANDVIAAMRLVPQVREDLDASEIRLIEAALDRGENFDSLGAACGLSRQGMRQRYQRLGGTRRWAGSDNDDSE
ncbi:hypothetical protein [Amycolatopsis sp. NPDC059657]|uniref:hypothetical protein n=1 Tax=Amycolatopsis sp. NPDC059657 TaxID=3346899 RepID=UPI00366AB2CC